jgi:hypothetical protein
VTIRRIEVGPQRPRRYLTAVANYNRSTDRVQIDVTALNQNIVPASGMRIKCDVQEGISSQQEKRLEADLRAPGYSAQLYAHLSASAPREVTVAIDVDDYPRAFVFRIPRNSSATEIQPADDMMNVRITSPDSGTAYRAPRDSVPTHMKVDAPEGSFGDSGNAAYIEIGLDADRDGELRDEQPLVLRSDRQIHVMATSLSPDGTLSLHTRVSDFVLEVPSTGFSDLAADLRGRLVSRLGAESSNPVEILFDGSGPVVRAEFVPGRQIEVGTELGVRVFSNVNDLSGVQKVEAVFDSVELSGPAAAAEEKPPWEVAKSEGSESWIATLKTQDLGLGFHTVLVRATDKVGNVGPIFRDQIELVVKKPEVKLTPEQEKARLANTVTGRVTWYGRQASAAKVTLESPAAPAMNPVTADADGGFSFEKVPPGAYTLKAESVINNKNRKGEVAITVPPRPATFAPVDLKLEPRTAAAEAGAP